MWTQDMLGNSLLCMLFKPTRAHSTVNSELWPQHPNPCADLPLPDAGLTTRDSHCGTQEPWGRLPETWDSQLSSNHQGRITLAEVPWGSRMGSTGKEARWRRLQPAQLGSGLPPARSSLRPPALGGTVLPNILLELSLRILVRCLAFCLGVVSLNLTYN